MLQREESDQELMLRVQGEDAEAFSELMRRYRPRLVGFFFKLARDEGLAEDLYQETFLRIWKARLRYRPTARFSTYLMEIARNLWLNERPRWLRRAETESLDEMEERPDALRAAAEEAAQLPEQILLRRERDRRVHEAIRELSPPLLMVFVLGRLEGCKYREIAGMLGIPEGTVKWRMSEATRCLRALLTDLCDEY